MDSIQKDLMNVNNKSDDNIEKYTVFPIIAGILLVFTGLISIVGWILFLNMEVSLLGDLLKQIQETVPSYSIDDLKNFISICSSIGIVVSIFPILGGILSIKKKLWGISLTSSIFGFVVIIPFIFLIFIPLISMILLIISRRYFKNIHN
jgi:membrane protease YdiL (CAAX protease family)